MASGKVKCDPRWRHRGRLQAYQRARPDMERRKAKPGADRTPSITSLESLWEPPILCQADLLPSTPSQRNDSDALCFQSISLSRHAQARVASGRDESG